MICSLALFYEVNLAEEQSGFLMIIQEILSSQRTELPESAELISPVHLKKLNLIQTAKPYMQSATPMQGKGLLLSPFLIAYIRAILIHLSYPCCVFILLSSQSQFCCWHHVFQTLNADFWRANMFYHALTFLKFC